MGLSALVQGNREKLLVLSDEAVPAPELAMGLSVASTSG